VERGSDKREVQSVIGHVRGELTCEFLSLLGSASIPAESQVHPVLNFSSCFFCTRGSGSAPGIPEVVAGGRWCVSLWCVDPGQLGAGY